MAAGYQNSNVSYDEVDIRNSYGYSVSGFKAIGGEGIHVFDDNGKSYIDCSAGTFNLSLGHRHPAIIQAIRDCADSALHMPSSFQTDAVNALVRRLVQLSPGNLTRVNLKVSGGSTANEGAIKMAQLATGRRDVISTFRSHHGQTMFTTAISGNAFRREALPLAPVSAVIVPDPYCKRCFYGQLRDTCSLRCVSGIDEFIEFASSGSPACIIVEPISGNGGNIVPPAGYLEQLRSFCTEREIALVFDEVQTGIGRLGTLFAADYFNVAPDIMTIGKGLGGGAQIAGILSAENYGLLETELHSFTYGANVMAAAIAGAVLDVVAQPSFLANVRSTGTYIMQRLLDIAGRTPQMFDVRGAGLMIGVEIADAQGAPDPLTANEIAQRGPEHGLLLRTSRYGKGNVVKFRPALTMTKDEADLMCDRMEALCDSVFGRS